MRSPKLLMAALIVGAALAAMMFRPGDAFAGVTVCDTDPIVTLSNGATVTLDAKVYDTQSDLQSVNYTLHVPWGVSVTNVQYDSTYGSLETFTWVPDQRFGSYRATTLALTGVGGVQVQTTMALSGNGCWSTRSTYGTSGQATSVSLSCWPDN